MLNLGVIAVLASSTVLGVSSATPKGIINLGNTCYLNSQLQCQFHIPLVRELILQSDERVCSLKSVFEMLNSKGTTPGNPIGLCRRLGINVYEQQDAQEFWKLILTNDINNYLPTMVDLYQGAFEDYIIAQDGSGRERRREETFLDLSLEIDTNSAKSNVISALNNTFGTPELLSEEEGNGWRPESGAKPVDALKGSLLQVNGLPSILQLHLKRFNYDWMSDTMSKINARFEFPEILDMSSLCAESDEVSEGAIFDLQSIVVHNGEYGSGHYYAYVRTSMNEKRWFRFDDQRVTQVDYSEVIADSFGGPSLQQGVPRNIFARIFRPGRQGNAQRYGYGGKTSSAYMLQYVKRQDIPELYQMRETCNK